MISKELAEVLAITCPNPEGESFCLKNRQMLFYLPAGVVRHLRINSRWIKDCRDKLTDSFPVMLIEGGETTYWNYAEFLDSSGTVVSGLGERSVRLASSGAVLCR